MWVFAILVLVTGALILFIVAMLIGPIVGPLYEIVVADPAVQAVGFDTGAEVAMRIGAKYTLPLIALSLVIWFFALRLRADQYQGVRRR